MFKNLKTQLMIAMMTMLCLPVQTAHAFFDEDPTPTLSAFKPVFDLIKKPLSMILIILCFASAIFCIVKALLAFAAYNQEENPNEKKQKKDLAIRNFIAAGVFISIPILANIFINIFGIKF